MKRYIEANALIEDFRHCGADKELIDAIAHRISLTPTADVVEVVRCKDCRLCEKMDGLIGGTCLYCTHWNHNVEPDGFCNEGW